MKQLKYSKAPSIIWRLPINANEKIILHQFAYWGGDVEKKNQDEIAYICGMSKVTANKCLMQLEKDGYIIKGEQKYSDKNKRIALSYSINWSKIESYATASDYFETKSFDETPIEQEEIKTVTVEENSEETKPTFSIIDNQEEEDEPDMSKPIPIEEKVSQMFVPIFNNYCCTKDMNTFANAMDNSINMLYLIYQDYEKDEIKEMFKAELLKRKQSVAA